ncbi:MAG: LysO family transporter [Candidatus Bathyarchaeia archaeon]
MVNPLDVLRVFIPLFLGLVLGYILRRGKKRLNLDRLIFWVILFLVFSLGFTVGSNNELLAVMPDAGFKAVVLSAMTLIFTILFIKALGKMVRV